MLAGGFGYNVDQQTREGEGGVLDLVENAQKFAPGDSRILAALVLGASARQAAARAEVHPETVRRRLAKPEFVAAVERARELSQQTAPTPELRDLSDLYDVREALVDAWRRLEPRRGAAIADVRIGLSGLLDDLDGYLDLAELRIRSFHP